MLLRNPLNCVAQQQLDDPVVCADGYTIVAGGWARRAAGSLADLCSMIQIATGTCLAMHYIYDGGAAVAPGRGAVPAGAGAGVRVARGRVAIRPGAAAPVLAPVGPQRSHIDLCIILLP